MHSKIHKKHIRFLLSGTVSAAAKLMLEAYGDLGLPLAGIERSFMIAYVDAEGVSENHALKDYETIYSLAGVNGLVDYIGGKVATAVNAPTHDINGYTFDETTNYIETNYNPATDATNYLLNSNSVSSFIYNFVADGSQRYMWGNVNSGNRSELWELSGGTTRGYSQNNTPISIGSSIASKSLYTITRSASALTTMYKDGISIGTNTSTSIAIDSGTYHVGKKNGNAAIINGTISSFMTGGALVSETGHNTNLRALLAGLGVSL